MAGPMPEIHDATIASSQAALFGFVGIGSQQRDRVRELALAKACLAQIARLFGPEAAGPRATLYKDRSADPFTATPTDADSVGHLSHAET